MTEAFDYELHSKPTDYLPNKPSWGFYRYSIEIPGIPLITVLDQFAELFSKIEELTKYTWDSDHFVWHIEYATTPIEFTVDVHSRHIIHMGKMIAVMAAQSAINKFPYLFDFIDDYIGEYRSIADDRKWHKSELRFYWDSVKQCLFIEFNRMIGCAASFIYVWKQIVSHFSVYILRHKYSGLGIESGLGNDNRHIQNYLIH
jgi:hypothetical protein